MGDRKVLATMGLGRHEEFLEVTLPSFERYAALHGYELHMPDSDPAPERRHKHWGKVAFINRLLPTCDLLFWIDSDAAIVDPSVDIATELPRNKFFGLVEHHYDGQSVPNTGVMVVRGGRRGRKFFHEMWEHTEFLETRWHDNAAALTMLGYSFDPEATPMYCRPDHSTPWLRRTQFLGIEWNSMPQDTADSPRILHVTGAFAFEDRLERLRSALS
jgi:galactosyl transferase GMA12/MNN10 family